MAENVILNVQLSGAEAAIGQLTELDSILNRVKANRNVKVSVSASGISGAAAQAEKLSTNLASAGQSAQQMGTSGAKAVNTAGTAVQKVSRNAESLRVGFGSVVGNMLKFRVASTIINTAGNALKSAFQEMKNVDTELVNIRKVTGFTNAEIEKLSKNAYSLATQYGRSASEALEASTVFARAGYTEQIGQLSELSLLLQNVGDLQADEASRFIIATDKAYKLGGSYENLIQVIDGLDNITNKNATDMQKMTEGMTVAGSVFAESGESVEMFAAMLGTATANTQRSGAEMARGLRTILMNLRQIRGETEDGQLIDGESIANAAKALKEYANISTMENGQLRKASDVLADLAGKWDTLTETQRAAISEAVAGKRQANVLMSLMGDWESVTRMMQQYEEAAGTAAKENAYYMDSWQAKTAQVSAAWNEMIASVVQTDGIKKVLDSGIGFIGKLGTLFQGDSFQGIFDVFADTIGVLGEVLSSPVVKTIIDFSNGVTKIALEGVDLLVDGINDLFSLLNKNTGDYKTRAEDTAKTAADMLKSYEEDFGNGSRYRELANNIDNLTESERVELGVLELQRQEREKALNDAKKAADEAAQEVERQIHLEKEQQEERKKAAREAKERDASYYLKSMQENLDLANADFLNTADVNSYIDAVTRALQTGSEYYAQLSQIRNSGGELLADEQKYLDIYEYAMQTFTAGESAIDVLAQYAALVSYAAGESWESAAEYGNQFANDFEKLWGETTSSLPEFKIIANNDDALSKIAEAKEAAESGATMPISVSFAGLSESILSSFFGFASGTKGAPGGPALVNENGPEMISANGLAWIAGGGKPTVTMLPKGATVLTASQTRNALGGIPAFESGTGNNYIGNILDEIWNQIITEPTKTKPNQYVDPNTPPASATPRSAGPSAPNKERKKKFLNPGRIGDDSWEALQEVLNVADQIAGSNPYYGNAGASGPSKPDVQKLQKELDDLLKNLNLQAELAENEEDFLRAMQIYGLAQDKIAELIEQYREAGYAEDSNEILELKNMGYDYAAKQLGGYDKLQDRLVDALNALTESTDKANELAERREAVDKAREALANAEKQRTVRIFNPVTGQWEWVANVADVQQAQENLKKAEDSLRKEELSQALDAIKNAKPEELANLTLSPAILEALFNGAPEQQNAFLDALGAATGGADWLASDEAVTEWNQGTSIGTQYNLDGITLTDEMAGGMTIRDLLAMLQSLRII